MESPTEESSAISAFSKYLDEIRKVLEIRVKHGNPENIGDFSFPENITKVDEGIKTVNGYMENNMHVNIFSEPELQRVFNDTQLIFSQLRQVLQMKAPKGVDPQKFPKLKSDMSKALDSDLYPAQEILLSIFSDQLTRGKERIDREGKIEAFDQYDLVEAINNADSFLRKTFPKDYADTFKIDLQGFCAGLSILNAAHSPLYLENADTSTTHGSPFVTRIKNDIKLLEALTPKDGTKLDPITLRIVHSRIREILETYYAIAYSKEFKEANPVSSGDPLSLGPGEFSLGIVPRAQSLFARVAGYSNELGFGDDEDKYFKEIQGSNMELSNYLFREAQRLMEKTSEMLAKLEKEKPEVLKLLDTSGRRIQSFVLILNSSKYSFEEHKEVCDGNHAIQVTIYKTGMPHEEELRAFYFDSNIGEASNLTRVELSQNLFRSRLDLDIQTFEDDNDREGPISSQFTYFRPVQECIGIEETYNLRDKDWTYLSPEYLTEKLDAFIMKLEKDRTKEHRFYENLSHLLMKYGIFSNRDEVENLRLKLRDLVIIRNCSYLLIWKMKENNENTESEVAELRKYETEISDLLFSELEKQMKNLPKQKQL